MMISKKVYPVTREISLAKTLYEESFPEVERLPWWWMVVMALLGQADFLVYFSGNQFCGMTYSLKSKDAYYLLFLAVSPQQQSQGYGTKILSEIATKAGSRPIYLVIEPIDEVAENYQQRLKRLNFYQRNGYYLTDYLYYENQEEYQVLTNGQSVKVTDFEKLAKRIQSSGIHIRVEKMRKINHFP